MLPAACTPQQSWPCLRVPSLKGVHAQHWPTSGHVHPCWPARCNNETAGSNSCRRTATGSGRPVAPALLEALQGCLPHTLVMGVALTSWTRRQTRTLWSLEAAQRTPGEGDSCCSLV